MKKDHLEILLEDISNKLSVVVEGHSVLDNKIERSIQENEVAHKALFQMIKEVSQKADNTQKELQDTRQELKQEIDDTRQELKQDIKELRQENKAEHKKILTKTESLESRVTFLEKKTAHQ